MIWLKEKIFFVFQQKDFKELFISIIIISRICRLRILAIEADLVLKFKSAWYDVVVGINTELYWVAGESEALEEIKGTKFLILKSREKTWSEKLKDA